MKKLLMIIPLVFLLCFTFGCQQGEEVAEEPVVDVEADIQVIKGLVREWTEAFNAGDIDKLISFYTDNSFRIPANQAPIIGKEAIRDNFQQLFDQYTSEQNSEVLDVIVCGDHAFVRGTWANTLTIKATGESLKINGNWVDLDQKQPDGSWKIIWSFWSNESLISPLQPVEE
jgi:uncharacterized protein (TIGR02246 family)